MNGIQLSSKAAVPKYPSEPGSGVGSGIKVLILPPQNPKPWSSSPAVIQRDVSGAACPGCAVHSLQGYSPQKKQA